MSVKGRKVKINANKFCSLKLNTYLCNRYQFIDILTRTRHTDNIIHISQIYD